MKSWLRFGIGTACLVVVDVSCSVLVLGGGLTYYQLGVALVVRALFLIGSTIAIRFRPPAKKPLLLGSLGLAFLAFALPERSSAGLAVFSASSATAFVALAYEPNVRSKVRLASRAMGIVASAISMIAIVLVLTRSIWLPAGPLGTVMVILTFGSLRKGSGGSVRASA